MFRLRVGPHTGCFEPGIDFMAKLKLSTRNPSSKLKPGTVQLIASGDLRLSANQVCWPAQLAMEQELTRAIEAEGHRVHRAIPTRKRPGTGSLVPKRKAWKSSANWIRMPP
jgi:hypothetical protein